MVITEVKVSLKNEAKLKGFANITLDDLLVIRGLKIIQGVKGYFIAMPTRKRKNGMVTDVAHPICREFREQMEKAKDNARTKGEAEARRIVRQAQQQAEVTGSRPVLFWRASRRPWVAYVDLHDVSPAAFPVRGRHRCAMSLDDWCQLAREAA